MAGRRGYCRLVSITNEDGAPEWELGDSIEITLDGDDDGDPGGDDGDGRDAGTGGADGGDDVDDHADGREV